MKAESASSATVSSSRSAKVKLESFALVLLYRFVQTTIKTDIYASRNIHEAAHGDMQCIVVCTETDGAACTHGKEIKNIQEEMCLISCYFKVFWVFFLSSLFHILRWNFVVCRHFPFRGGIF